MIRIFYSAVFTVLLIYTNGISAEVESANPENAASAEKTEQVVPADSDELPQETIILKDEPEVDSGTGKSPADINVEAIDKKEGEEKEPVKEAEETEESGSETIKDEDQVKPDTDENSPADKPSGPSEPPAAPELKEQGEVPKEEAGDAPEKDAPVDDTGPGDAAEGVEGSETDPETPVEPEQETAEGVKEETPSETAEPGDGEQQVEKEKEETVVAETVEKKPDKLEPLFVKPLYEISSGRNDSNPSWSPSGQLIAFERSIGDKREIIVSRLDGSVVQRIYSQPPVEENEMEFIFPGIVEDISYNSGISWSPDEKSMVYMSNAGSGNYDLYLLSKLGEKETIRLTEDNERDSHPHWAPGSNRLVFVSGRTGKADVYLMDLVTRKAAKITQGEKTYLYPQWSPDGGNIVMIYGSNENHDIYLIKNVNDPMNSIEPLTTWTFDDLRPIWSPDGKKIAFYSNYNLDNDQKRWAIIVINADGSEPKEGDALAQKVVATNVIPDIDRGPAWMADSKTIVYVKNDKKSYNPIYMIDIETKTTYQIETQTKMNHDVVCSLDGTLAFRAQVEQWDHIYISKLK